MSLNAKKSWHVQGEGARARLSRLRAQNQRKKESRRRQNQLRDQEFIQESNEKLLQENLEFVAEGEKEEKKVERVDFLYMPPPEPESDDEVRPEDEIPDTPENAKTREFLKNAPKKGLWLPMEGINVMKCWRCGNYGHVTGDRKCPKFLSGILENEEFYMRHEDPMVNVMVTLTLLEVSIFFSIPQKIPA
eukprot:TRINITY_DN1309_c0_g1_i1.p1 TRINITY_DN1309_c0_g1~~TRINITY_DN1309_c0_g1_i1.p1  ORF type:complete len:190 (+),score=45.46 TRINITY_DN1309_c0_g1_i1:212-781(+)